MAPFDPPSAVLVVRHLRAPRAGQGATAAPRPVPREAVPQRVNGVPAGGRSQLSVGAELPVRDPVKALGLSLVYSCVRVKEVRSQLVGERSLSQRQWRDEGWQVRHP